MGKPNDLVQGTLDLLILKTIALEPKHGWAIAKRTQHISKEVLQVQQESLYPGAGEVGGDRDRTAGEVLFVDGGGAGAVGERDEELEPIIDGY